MIMQGGNQQSKSWSVLSENLGRLGQQVGQQLAMREYQKQAAEALPVLQQQMQAALQDAGSGRSADAYSKLLPLISNPQYNQNPILLPGLEAALKATKDESDNFLMKQKTQQGSQYGIADLLLAKQFGVDLTQQPGAVTTPATGGGGTGQPPTSNQPTTDTSKLPVYGNDKPIAGKHLQEIDIMNLQPQETGEFTVPIPMASGKTMYGRYLTALPVTDDDQKALTDSANVFSEIQQKVQNEGTSAALATLNYVDESQFSDKNIEDKFSIIPLPQSASKFLGEGIDSMAVPKDIEGLRQSGLTLKGQYGNINFSNINNSEKSKELRQLFLSTINTQINRLNNSKEINDLIKHYGGFDKIGPYAEDPKTGNIFWKIEDKEGKVKTIKLGTGTKDNPGLKETFLGVINAPNQAAIFGMPMLRSNMPSPNVPQNTGREKSLEEML